MQKNQKSSYVFLFHNVVTFFGLGQFGKRFLIRYSEETCTTFVTSPNYTLMADLHSHLGYSLRFLARCEWDEVRKNLDIHTLMWESSITRLDIRDILVSFNLGMIYRHVSKSFETKTGRKCGNWNECTFHTLVLVFLSCLVLSLWECEPGIRTVCMLSFIRSSLRGCPC